MREIKFRAWCEGKHDNMTFPEPQMEYDVTIADGVYASVESGWDIHGTYPTVPLMQYTGLKDKNGVEIYEHDIILVETNDDKSAKIVEYSNENMCYMWSKSLISPVAERMPNTKQARNIVDGRCKSFEIIGNIYENPQLLNQKQYDIQSKDIKVAR